MFRKIWNNFHTGIFVDACKYGDIAQVHMMLKKQPELAYLKDKKGISAFFYAVANGHADIVHTLLRVTRQPDDVEAQVHMMLKKEPELAYLKDKKGISAFFYAVANGHADIVHTLLRVTRQPDDVESEKGFTPLLIAATNGHDAIVRILLEHGANPNLRNFDGVTALHNAVFEKQIEVVRLLLKHGADPTIQGRLGNTTMDLAKRSLDSRLVQLFK